MKLDETTGVVLRAPGGALLWAGEGVANEEIARRSGVDSDTVRRWRNGSLTTGLPVSG